MPNDTAVTDILKAMENARSETAALRAIGKEAADLQTFQTVKNEMLTIESKASGIMKSLGCTHPLTRKIQRALADMLIQWYAFVDDLD